MTNPHLNPEEFLKRAKGVGIPAHEKARMRSTLSEYAGHTGEAVRVGEPERLISRSSRLVPSPYYRYPFTLLKPMPIAIAAIIVVVLGGGTSYAAQGSLPGDILYPVKVHVNEPVEETFAFSTNARAQVEANIAADRLDEAAKLAAQGRLSTTTATELTAEFESHAHQAHVSVAALAEENPRAALAVDSALTARINENKTALNALVTEGKNVSVITNFLSSIAVQDQGVTTTGGATITGSDTGSAEGVLQGNMREEDSGNTHSPSASSSSVGIHANSNSDVKVATSSVTGGVHVGTSSGLHLNLDGE